MLKRDAERFRKLDERIRVCDTKVCEKRDRYRKKQRYQSLFFAH